MNMLRKELIKPDTIDMHTNVKVWCPQRLFGNDLAKRVKDIDEEQKTVGVIRFPRKRDAKRGKPLTGFQGTVDNNRTFTKHF